MSCTNVKIPKKGQQKIRTPFSRWAKELYCTTYVSNTYVSGTITYHWTISLSLHQMLDQLVHPYKLTLVNYHCQRVELLNS